jgi:hypothetical protein
MHRASRLQLNVTDAKADILDQFKDYCLKRFGKNTVTEKIMSMIYRELNNAINTGEYKPTQKKKEK